ncbi:hypothetical protein [Bacillus thuringiensis]|nr:hypothetical protein [Bacillus thuringiensis]
MEKYKKISLADMLVLIANGEFNEIYLQQKSTGLVKTIDCNWKLNKFVKYKFFKREGVE